MSRFDSPVQVVGLFLIVSLVSIVLIFLINAETEAGTRRLEANKLTTNNRNADEANSIEQQSSTTSSNEPITKPHTSFFTYLETEVGRFIGLHRRKRSLKSDGRKPYLDFGLTNVRTNSSNLLVGRNTNSMGTNSQQESESVRKMSTSSDIHKIRHAMRKLDEKGLDGVLRMIFDSNSITEPQRRPNSNHQHEPVLERSDNLYPHHHRRIIENPESHMNNQKEDVDLNSRTTHQQEQVFSRDSMVQTKTKVDRNIKETQNYNVWKKQRNFENRVHDDGLEEYLGYMVDSAPVTDSAIGAIGTIIKPSGSSSPLDILDEDKRSLNLNLNSQLNQSYFSTAMTSTGNVVTVDGKMHKKSAGVLKQNLNICYKTNDVLVVIAITCCLNLAFVLVIWACVRWFTIVTSKDMKVFQHLDCDEGGDSSIFPHETVDNCWVPEIHRSQKYPPIKLRAGRQTSTSLYTFRPDTVPQHHLRKYKSYSMEELRFFIQDT